MKVKFMKITKYEEKQLFKKHTKEKETNVLKYVVILLTIINMINIASIYIEIHIIQNSNAKSKEIEVITTIDESEEYMSIRFVPKEKN